MTYQDVIAEIGQGDELPPLVKKPAANKLLLDRLRKTKPEELFPRSRSARGAMAGLWLMADGWREAHEVAQALHTPEGSYWHAIVHRMEPDADNARYWFRQLGGHAIFAELHQKAEEAARNRPFAGFRPGASWDPMSFLAFFEKARGQRDSEAEWLARDIQYAERQLLFEYCAAMHE